MTAQSDLKATIAHVAEALERCANAAQWHHSQGRKRGLTGRGIRALAGAICRTEVLAGELASVGCDVRGQHVWANALRMDAARIRASAVNQ